MLARGILKLGAFPAGFAVGALIALAWIAVASQYGLYESLRFSTPLPNIYQSTASAGGTCEPLNTPDDPSVACTFNDRLREYWVIARVRRGVTSKGFAFKNHPLHPMFSTHSHW